MLGGQCERVPVGWGGRRGRFPRRAQQLTGVELRESTTVAGRPLSMPMGWATSLAEEIDRERPRYRAECATEQLAGLGEVHSTIVRTTRDPPSPSHRG